MYLRTFVCPAPAVVLSFLNRSENEHGIVKVAGT